MAFTLVARRVPVNSDGRVIGEAHHRSTVSDAKVELILDLGYADPPVPAAHIAAQVGVSRRTVRDIIGGRRRTHHVDGYKVVLVRVVAPDA